jgi:hypothetical protein
VTPSIEEIISFLQLNEDDKRDLRAKRSAIISVLGTIEEILNEKHGMNLATV